MGVFVCLHPGQIATYGMLDTGMIRFVATHPYLWSGVFFTDLRQEAKITPTGSEVRRLESQICMRDDHEIESDPCRWLGEESRREDELMLSECREKFLEFFDRVGDTTIDDETVCVIALCDPALEMLQSFAEVIETMTVTVFARTFPWIVRLAEMAKPEELFLHILMSSDREITVGTVGDGATVFADDPRGETTLGADDENTLFLCECFGKFLFEWFGKRFARELTFVYEDDLFARRVCGGEKHGGAWCILVYAACW